MTPLPSTLSSGSLSNMAIDRLECASLLHVTTLIFYLILPLPLSLLLSFIVHCFLRLPTTFLEDPVEFAAAVFLPATLVGYNYGFSVSAIAAIYSIVLFLSPVELHDGSNDQQLKQSDTLCVELDVSHNGSDGDCKVEGYFKNVLYASYSKEIADAFNEDSAKDAALRDCEVKDRVEGGDDRGGEGWDLLTAEDVNGLVAEIEERRKRRGWHQAFGELSSAYKRMIR